MSHNCKNYKTDGGDTLVIGGKLVIEDGATVQGGGFDQLAPATADALGGVKIGDNITVDAAGVIAVPDAAAAAKGVVLQGVAVADAAGEAPTAAEFKALLDSLRGAGIIATAEAGS